jgi:hypothetical protein
LHGSAIELSKDGLEVRSEVDQALPAMEYGRMVVATQRREAEGEVPHACEPAFTYLGIRVGSRRQFRCKRTRN